MKIKTIRSRWVLDSRGDPTIEVDVVLSSGALGRASVPAGASIGKSEAAELRDTKGMFSGRGVSKALNNIEHRIAPALIGKPADHQEAIDAQLCALDGTSDKRRLGANATLAVSLATAKAAAQAKNVPFYRYIAQLAGTKPSLPMPMFNLMNGGAHAVGTVDFQECMIIPKSATDIYTAIRMATEVYHQLKVLLVNKGFSTALGDEGGFAPQGLRYTTVMFDLVIKAITNAGYKAGEDVVLAIDVAASELYKRGRYHLAQEGHELGARGMTSWYDTLLESYPIVSIEDPFDQDAWADWRDFTKNHIGIQIVADDLVTTNGQRLNRAVRYEAANTLLVKPNQIGTLTETIHTTKAAQAAGWRTIVSHRSGETEDTTIAHLAVGLGCGQIKAGSVARGERTAKYNELLRIAESLGSDRLALVWL